MLLAATAAAAGCSQVKLPTLPSAPPAATASLSTGAVDAAAPPATAEWTTLVQGTPTRVYELVARGAMRCWFGSVGPLKTTHIFHAEAPPPARGAGAEIVLHEREGDQRGYKAFRVGFANEAGLVRVSIAAMRMAQPLAELMAKDVEAWAAGDSGCRVRPPEPPPPEASPTKKGAPRAVQR